MKYVREITDFSRICIILKWNKAELLKTWIKWNLGELEWNLNNINTVIAEDYLCKKNGYSNLILTSNWGF